VSASFAGKTRIQQHQMVYAALGDAMAGPIHALQLRTAAPKS
jgi:stress-induced morphogen